MTSQNPYSQKAFRFSILCLLILSFFFKFSLSDFYGFFLIAFGLLFLFSFVNAIKSWREPSSFQKIVGLTLNGFFLILFLTFIGIVGIKIYRDQNSNFTPTNQDQCIQYQIQFPDTVKVNQKIYGVIKFKSCLDSVLDFDKRQVNLNLFDDFTQERLKTKQTKPFIATKNGWLPITFCFKNCGPNQLNGLLIDISKPKALPKDSVIIKTVMIKKEVYVVE